MSGGISGGPTLRWNLWFYKKQAQVFISRRLSDILATFLVVLVVIREKADLVTIWKALSIKQWLLLIFLIAAICSAIWYVWIRALRQRVSILFHIWLVAALLLALGQFRSWLGLSSAIRTVPAGEWLIAVITLGTFAAALWEFFGIRLKITPHEIRISAAVRVLVSRMERFCLEGSKAKRISLADIVQEFLNMTASAMCGSLKVDANLMMPLNGSLVIVAESKGANFPKVSIPLPGSGESTGAAGLAFKQQLVYVPDKESKEAWSLKQQTADEYSFSSSPVEAWIPASDPKAEKFRSVLCVPVSSYEGDGTWKAIGVINYCTRARDPFVPRDFLLAECFVGMLSQALAFNGKMEICRRNLAELDKITDPNLVKESIRRFGDALKI